MKPLVPLALFALLAGCSETTTTSTTEVTKEINSIASSAPAAAFKDALIAAAIKTKLAADDIDSATRVHVSVEAGHVKLAGVTRSQNEKDLATSDARGVTGVSAVDNLLTVDPKLPKTSERAADLELEAKLTAELAAQTGINAATVKISAHAGVVTLSGRAPSAAIKTTMLETVRKDSGVRSLVDKIAVVGST